MTRRDLAHLRDDLGAGLLGGGAAGAEPAAGRRVQRGRLAAGDPESVSQAMNTVRRLIDGVADNLFPARDEPYMLGQTKLKVTKMLTYLPHGVGVGLPCIL